MLRLDSFALTRTKAKPAKGHKARSGPRKGETREHETCEGAKSAKGRNPLRGENRNPPRDETCREAKPAKGQNPHRGETRTGAKPAHGRNPHRSNICYVRETFYTSKLVQQCNISPPFWTLVLQKF